MKSTMVLMSLALLAFYAAALAGEGARQETGLREDLARRFEDPEEDWDLVDAAGALSEKAGAEDLDRLAAHENLTVAMAAAWERVRRTFPKGEDAANAPVDALALARFLGFTEGRLHVPLPDFWRSAVTRAHLTTQGSVSFDLPHEWGVYKELEEPGEDDPHVRIEEKQTYVVTLGEEEWRIDFEGELRYAEPLWEILAAQVVLTDETAYVLLHTLNDVWAGPCAFERETGELLWESRAWVSPMIAIGGYFYVDFALRVLDDKVYVFAAGGILVFVEGFDRETGAPLLRFGTVYPEVWERREAEED